MSTNIVVQCFSGGLDSTVLLYHLKHMGYDVHTFSVHYGQKHAIELQSAMRITNLLGVESYHVDLTGHRGLFMGSSQTDDRVKVPEGHYAEESMKATVVPNRNMILLAMATARAISLKAEIVAYAAHAGDHVIYPDCRPQFANAMAEAIKLCDWSTPELFRPFIVMTKAEIVKLGAELQVPFALTYSCYKGGPKHCGKCGTCVERREAFELAGVDDPTQYYEHSGMGSNPCPTAGEIV